MRSEQLSGDCVRCGRGANVRRGFLGSLLVLGLLLVGCGGSSGDPTQEPAATEDDSSAGGQVEATATTAPDGGGGENSVAEGTAMVILGNETWSFALSGDSREMCNPDFAGLFFVSMFGTDDAGDEIVFSLNGRPGEGTGVVQAGASAISGQLWISDRSIYSGFPDLPAGIDASLQIDGNQASGSATFYEDRALQQARQTGDSYQAGLKEGTFSVTCPS